MGLYSLLAADVMAGMEGNVHKCALLDMRILFRRLEIAVTSVSKEPW